MHHNNVPDEAEAHVLSNFISYKSGGRSKFINSDLPPKPQFFCPGCGLENEPPEQGFTRKCTRCTLHWFPAGNVLYLWRRDNQ